jgi:hypothetical protein
VPDAEPEPPLATTGTDFDAVWRSIAARHAWLYRHPDPDGLDALLLPRCLCYEESRAQLAAYEDQGRWWTGARPAVTAVEVRDASAPNLVTLRVTSVREGESQLVDATGAVHETAPARGPFHTNVVLARDSPRAPWLVLDLADQGPVPGAP